MLERLALDRVVLRWLKVGPSTTRDRPTLDPGHLWCELAFRRYWALPYSSPVSSGVVSSGDRRHSVGLCVCRISDGHNIDYPGVFCDGITSVRRRISGEL